jgi:hypothetical protein
MKPAAKGGAQNKIRTLNYFRQLGQLLANFAPQDTKKAYHWLKSVHLGIAPEQGSEIASQSLKGATAIFNPGPMLRRCSDEGLVAPADQCPRQSNQGLNVTPRATGRNDYFFGSIQIEKISPK